MNRFLRAVLVAVGLTAVALVVASCGSSKKSSSTAASSNAASKPAKAAHANLRVMLDWVPNAPHAPIFYAQDQGLFTKANLSVNITKPPSATAPLVFAAAGKTDLAIAYEPDLMVSSAATAGKVKAVFALATRPLAGLWFGKGSSGTVAGLKGKTVGWFGIPYEKPMMETALAKVGLKLSDIKFVNAGFNTNPALLSGKLDAAMGTYWNAEPVSNPNLKITPVDKLGVPTYDELVIVANAAKLQNDPAYVSAVKRFLGVLQQAVPAVRKDPTLGYTAISKVDKEPDLQKKVDVTLPAEAPHAGMNTGCFNLQPWQAFANWLYTNKQTKTKVDPTTLATNQYLSGC